MSSKKVGLWMYSNEGGDQSQKLLSELLTEHGLTVFANININQSIVKNGQVFTNTGLCLNDLDLIFSMNADEQSDFQKDILKYLEYCGVRIINSTQSFSMAQDKFLTNCVLRKNGVLVPDSFLIGENFNESFYFEIFSKYKKLLLKPRRNHGGKGILLFESFDAFSDFHSAFSNKIKDFYLEEFIEFDRTDVRVELINNSVIGSYSRTSFHRFKTNVAAGGSIQSHELTDQQSEIARKCSQILKLDCTIIDMIQSVENKLYYVLEVNPQLGIFIESAISSSPKYKHKRTLDQRYCYDHTKLVELANFISIAVHKERPQ